MRKFCSFLIYEGNTKLFLNTLNNLKELLDLNYLNSLFIIFGEGKQLYDIDKSIIGQLNQLPSDIVSIIFTDDKKGAVQQVTNEFVENSDILFFIKEGDSVAPTYLEYIDYFFSDNANNCDLVVTPVVASETCELPEIFQQTQQNGLYILDSSNTGMVMLEYLLTSTRGLAVLTSTLKYIELQYNLEFEAFQDLLIKAALKKGCIGLLDTVVYIKSPTNDTKPVTIEQILSISEFAEKEFSETPDNIRLFLQNQIEYQLDKTVDQFDDSLYTLIEKFSKSATLNETLIRITSIQNDFSNCKISGSLTISALEEDLDLYIISNEKTILATLIDSPVITCRDKIQRNIDFFANIELRDNCTNIQFLLHTKSGRKAINIFDCNNKIINNYKVRQQENELIITKIAARENYLVSCIIPIFNTEKYLTEAIDSVVTQTINFSQNIQLILVNDGSSDESESICKEYEKKYPFNVMYIAQQNLGVSAARNTGLNHAIGEYIAFLDSDDKYDTQFFELGVNYLNKNAREIDLVAFPIKYFGTRDILPEPMLNFRFNNTKIVDVTKAYNYVQFSACSVIIKKDSIEDIRFNVDLSYLEDAEFVHRVILGRQKYGLIKEAAYLYRIREDGTSALQSKLQDLNWYNRSRTFGESIVEYSLQNFKYVSKYTQYLLIYELRDSIVKDIPSEIENIIDRQSILDSLKELIQYVDDSIIMTCNGLEYWFKCFLLETKYKEATLDRSIQIPTFYFGNTRFEQLCPEIRFTKISEKNNVLTLRGFYNLVSHKDISFVAIINGKTYTAQLSENKFRDVYFLGERVHKAHVFCLNIECTEEGTIQLFMKLKDGTLCAVKNVSPKNIALNNSEHSLYVGKSIIVKSTSKENSFYVDLKNDDKLKEAVTSYLKNFEDKKFADDCQVINEYLRCYMLFSKYKIWLFIDEPNSAGGNAEIFFDYCSKVNDGIDKYFVVNKNTIDAVRLEKFGTVIQYGSKLHKLLSMYADVVITSRIARENFEPFDSSSTELYNGLINSEIVYLPMEGVNSRDLKNIMLHGEQLSLVPINSSYEKEYICENTYVYDQNILQLFGNPKFDKLLSQEEPSKRIVLMLTWRKELYLGENQINFDFRDSNYCKTISELLCDERLFTAMYEYGYELDFLPDSKVYLQIADFDMYENVNVINPSISKQKVYESSTIVVTDYIPQFEFAYMNKPIIYYQFDGETNKDLIEQQCFDFQQNGFGEILTDHNELVNMLINCMENDCKMNKKYTKRVKNYFEHIDRNSCKRIYEALVKKDYV